MKLFNGDRLCIVSGSRIECLPDCNTLLCGPHLIIKAKEHSSLSFTFEVLHTTISNGSIPSDSTRFKVLAESLLPCSGYLLCTGIPTSIALSNKFLTKSARTWGFPFNRYDHKECAMWFKSNGVSTSRCEKCTNSMYYMKREAKKQEASISAQDKKLSSPAPVTMNLSPVKGKGRKGL